MAKNNWMLWVGLILAIFVVGMLLESNYNLFSISGSETMTRTLPTSVNPGSTFTLTYTAIGTSGDYGASVVDSVTGGCTPSSLKFVLTSPATTYQVTMTAPSSGTSCSFSGDYKYGDTATKTFSTQTVSLCVRNCNTRPTDLCQATSSDGCSGSCSWPVTKLSDNDINCDNSIDRNELGAGITKWVNGQETRDQLGIEISSWAGSS